MDGYRAARRFNSLLVHFYCFYAASAAAALQAAQPSQQAAAVPHTNTRTHRQQKGAGCCRSFNTMKKCDEVGKLLRLFALSFRTESQ